MYLIINVSRIAAFRFVFICLLLIACKATTIDSKTATDEKLFLGWHSAGYASNPYSQLIEKASKGCIINLGSKHKYGFNRKFENLQNGQYITATVEVKSKTGTGTFVCSVKQADTKFSIKKMPEQGNQGWQTLIIEQYINFDSTSLHFYVFANKGSVLFRDLRISAHQSIPQSKEFVSKMSGLNIVIPVESEKKLANYAKVAIEKGVIGKTEKESGLGYLMHGEDSIKIDIRLKGDWTDHLLSGKESYRIKIKDKYAFNGMRTFSIHHPKTRNYMHEWLMHQLCFKEGLLATRYEFLPVKINGVYKGIYAIEEHFEKELLQANGRRKAPILKFDESGTWALTLLQKNTPYKIHLPIFESSIISLFKKKKTMASKSLKNYFVEGSKLLQLHKDLNKNVANIFDLEAMAKYYALLELGNVEHGHQWHNNRFYYNPISQHLEMIGFDMNPGFSADDELYILKKIRAKTGPKSWQLIQPLLQNRIFKKYYLHYLKLFSSHEYLKATFKTFEQNIQAIERVLAAEMKHFAFDESFYYQRAVIIQSKLEVLDSLWEQRLNENIPMDRFFRKRIYKRNDTLPYLSEISVNAYVNTIKKDVFELEVCNYMPKTISVVGYINSEGHSINFDDQVELPQYNGVDQCEKMIVPEIPIKVLFKTSAKKDKVRSKKVFQWPKPSGETARIALEKGFKVKSPYYTIKYSSLAFQKGKIVLKELLYIPQSYKVTIRGETEIEFEKNGGIVCAGSIEINGSADKYVKIFSKGSKNNGLTILNGKQAVFKYVEFENMRALNYRGWTMTGGINIYDAPVKIVDCIIRNSAAQSTINLISCNYNISKLKIDNADHHGLDSDFCTGTIINSEFNNCGNNGVDFSGSDVQVDNIAINTAGNAGISCGEGSVISVFGSKVKDCSIGIGVTNESRVITNNCSWLNLGIGFAVYHKEPEYSKPQLHVKGYSQLESKTPVYSNHNLLRFYNSVMQSIIN